MVDESRRLRALALGRDRRALCRCEHARVEADRLHEQSRPSVRRVLSHAGSQARLALGRAVVRAHIVGSRRCQQLRELGICCRCRHAGAAHQQVQHGQAGGAVRRRGGVHQDVGARGGRPASEVCAGPVGVERRAPLARGRPGGLPGRPPRDQAGLLRGGAAAQQREGPERGREGDRSRLSDGEAEVAPRAEFGVLGELSWRSAAVPWCPLPFQLPCRAPPLFCCRWLAPGISRSSSWNSSFRGRVDSVS
mmetsp:Transcript_25178/g.71848  ORF Transcript_25178/g.71848 Transcript_25178/m.71848 type:complete len:250 (+) Transcript_25178:406-1155(+)